MENTQTLFDDDGKEQTGLTLRLNYMIEDFLELIQKEEREKLVGEES